MKTNPLASHWTLDPDVVFLNHGSFGATPRPVLEAQAALRAEMEREPVAFFVRRLEGLLDAARAELAALVGADPEGLAFVPNATFAVNSVLRSFELAPGDEVLITNHGYNACNNVARYVAERAGAKVVVATFPFVGVTPDLVIDAVLAALTDRTRIAILDTVTSPTGLVLPLDRLVPALEARGVATLVDGAHGVGMLPLDVGALAPAFFTSNCHKWLCAPKGAAFLSVRADWRERVRPAVVSHGANANRAGRSRFRVEFDWMGTVDPTAFLSVPAAIRFMNDVIDGGLAEVRHRNRNLVLEARALLADRLSVDLPCPDAMIGSLAALPLPDGVASPPASGLAIDPLQDALFARGIEVPIVPWPRAPSRLVRVSAQLYNSLDDYAALAEALDELL